MGVDLQRARAAEFARARAGVAEYALLLIIVGAIAAGIFTLSDDIWSVLARAGSMIRG